MSLDLLLNAQTLTFPVPDGMPATSLAPRYADPYFGLLTDPPGEWGLTSYNGDSHALVLKGGAEFRRRALNLLSSYVGGFKRQSRGIVFEDDSELDDSRPFATQHHLVKGLHIKEKDAQGNLMLVVNRGRLVEALSLWFYGRLFPFRAKTHPVIDEEGDFLDLELDDDSRLLKESANLAEAFVSSIQGHSCGCQFEEWAPTPEEDLSMGTLGATGTEDE